MRIHNWIEKRSIRFWIITGIVVLAVIAAFDFLTGYEWVWSLFYLLPIALLTWYVGRGAGIAASIVSALAAYLLDMQAAPSSILPAAYTWNGIVRLGFFLGAILLVLNLKKAHLRAEQLIRIDNLTGAVNARYFSELVNMEIERTQRTQRPFSIVYVDLDNFKSLNDNLGLSEGDEALRTIARLAKSALRKVDVVARVGGDEFAFLLPETNQAGSQSAMARLQASILDEMHKNNWSVTFSVGVLTCLKAAQTSDELIRRANELMVSAKQSGQNSIQYSVDAG
jgi:diguanylate cyclase (GGDEF)-like protein